MAVSSSSEMPEKSAAVWSTGKNSFIKSSFVENSTDLLLSFYYNQTTKARRHCNETTDHQIDENKCNGCGACAAACHEGAIAMVDGRLVEE